MTNRESPSRVQWAHRQSALEAVFWTACGFESWSGTAPGSAERLRGVHVIGSTDVDRRVGYPQELRVTSGIRRLHVRGGRWMTISRRVRFLSQERRDRGAGRVCARPAAPRFARL